MSSIMVLKSLKELFPQVDNRILKAASIEHANNLDAAVEFILLDVIPYLPTKSSQNEKLDRSSSRASSVRSDISNSNGADESQELYNSIVNSAPPKRNNNNVNNSGNNSSIISQSSNSSSENRNWDLSVLIANNKLANNQNRENKSNRSNGSNHFPSFESEMKQKGKNKQNGSNHFPSFESVMKQNGQFPSFESEMKKNGENEQNGSNGSNHFPSFESKMKKNVENGQNGSNGSNHFPSFESKMKKNVENEQNGSNGSNHFPSFESKMKKNVENEQNGSNGLNHFPSFESETKQHGENKQNGSNGSSQFPSFESEMKQNGENEPNVSIQFPSFESEMKQNGENEPNGSNGSSDFPSDLVTRSSCSVNAEFLEDFVNDAKNNKMDLMGSVETLTSMLHEVVQLEEKAKFAKDESSLAGQETLKKVEELKEMLVRAKEANEMHSGEVYGERSILSTEAREFQSRLFTLSEEKDRSLQIIEEIRVVLEARLKAAEEEILKAEKEKILKENLAKEALKEQEDLMNVIVEESKKLKQEAEENSKLREFLVDRSRIVDTLHGEISVICEDITKLKEIIHGNIPMTKSIFSTMSSLSTSVSASSSSERETLKNSTSSSEKNMEVERERGEMPNGGERENLSGSSDDWELFENEDEN